MRIRDAVLAAGLMIMGVAGFAPAEAQATEPARGSVWYVQASSLPALNSYLATENGAPTVERVSLQTVLEITHTDKGNFTGRAVQLQRGSDQPLSATPSCLRVIGSVSYGVVQFALVGNAMTNRGNGHGAFIRHNGRDRIQFQFTRATAPAAIAQNGVMTECKRGEACNASIPGGAGRTLAQFLALCPAS